MIRDILILTLAGFCLSAATLVNAEIANKEFLVKQEKVYNLFWNPGHPELQPEMYEMGRTYKYETHMDFYTLKDAFYEFLSLYKEHRMLPRGKVFSMFNSEQLHEAIVLFKIFYYAKDFDTFYLTAAFAKRFVNEGVYVYALGLAVVHRPDTKYIRIPYSHELYPFVYFNNDVMQSVNEAKLYQAHGHHVQSTDGAIIIPANYSTLYSRLVSQDDYKLMYYTEDVFLNELEYFSHLAYPFWMPSDKFDLQSERRGETYLYTWRMKFARYQLERISNDLYEIPQFDWNYPIPRGYYPNLNYHSGIPLPRRPADAIIPNYKFNAIRELRDLEYKIQAAIDSGYVFHKNGTYETIRTPYGIDIFGNLLAGNADSPNYDFYGNYEALARDVLGFSPVTGSKYDFVPSIMQHYGADQRDPMYWSLANRIAQYYKEFASYLPKYSFKELEYPDVKIESVEIPDVHTYFDTFDYTISSTVKVGTKDDMAYIKARQYRLNHKPATYKVVVNSAKPTTVMVRAFLGPKFDGGMSLADHYDLFVPIDQFVFELKAGVNNVVRSSTEFTGGEPDAVNSNVYYNEIEKAISGGAAYEVPRRLISFPRHIIFPKGKTQGATYQMFFFLTPYNAANTFEIKSGVFGEYRFPKVPFGYPFDRPVQFPIGKLPNAYSKEFSIYHKDTFHHTH
ncbi:arylphorin subunit alpha-like [Diprion similis]|uniref:arylphorin subunit alpha-like n=1 Tax=Diprion similis TaxID=362088 RepID=UPI001EF83FC3|nr:arylphorin subunit alpha-like [Diprion similis]